MNDAIADDLHQRVGGTWVLEYLPVLGNKIKVYRFRFPQIYLRSFFYYPDENVFKYITGTEYTEQDVKKYIKMHTKLANFA